MAIPNLEPVKLGGDWIGASEAGNALNRSNLENAAKAIENKYLPLKTKAQAASQLAYSNLVGPQFVAKLFGNEHILPSIPENQKKAGIQGLLQAGMNPQGSNTFNNLFGSDESSSNSFGSTAYGILLNRLFGGSNQSGNQIKNQQQPSYQQAPQAPQSSTNQEFGAVNKATPNEVNYYANNGNKIPYNAASPAANTDTANEPTVADNEAKYKRIVETGKKLGTESGQAISDIGKEQLALSASGVILDRLTGIIQNPIFSNMRKEIPFFQDKQLSFLSKTGKREQQKLIGDFISTAQAFKASTVNSFKGKALEKEFNLADKIKIDENDTIGVAEGKLQSLKTLKEIAQQKNDIVLGLMSAPYHMDLGQAIKEADKRIDIKGIEKDVDRILNPQPTEEDIQYMMNKRNLPRSEIIRQLKEKGYVNVS